jgi:Holliday junction resolvasome RuvABC DNA-binding subunit
MATLKMMQWFQKWVKSGNGTKAALQVYNCKNENVAAAIASRNLKKLKLDYSIQDWIDRLGMTDRKIISNLIKGTEAKVMTRYGLYPHWPARLKANEMLLKLKNKFPKNDNNDEKNLYLTQIIYED